jgi:hypothetical protein
MALAVVMLALLGAMIVPVKGVILWKSYGKTVCVPMIVEGDVF